MRIGKVIGVVTLSRCHQALVGLPLKIATPLSLEQLLGTAPSDSEPFVVIDELGAGIGDRIAISEGGEAAQPFFPQAKPVDAYNAAILDQVQISIKSFRK